MSCSLNSVASKDIVHALCGAPIPVNGDRGVLDVCLIFQTPLVTCLDVFSVLSRPPSFEV